MKTYSDLLLKMRVQRQPVAVKRFLLHRPSNDFGRHVRLIGVQWKPANREIDTVNRLRVGLWWAIEFAWWPRWAR